MRHEINSPTRPRNSRGTNHALFRVVPAKKVQRIARDHNPDSLLVVDRISNEATPVIILGKHFYYRIRDKASRIIWIRHVMPEEELLSKPLEERSPEEQMRVAYWIQWQAYNYFIDFKRRIKENAIAHCGQRIDPLDAEIKLSFNP